MAALKFIFSFILVVFYLSPHVELTALSNTFGSNLVIGSIQPGDKIVMDSKIVLDARPGQVVKADSGFFGYGIKVNFIAAIEIEGSQGGTAELREGNLGEDMVRVQLTSAFGSGLRYLIIMYGQ